MLARGKAKIVSNNMATGDGFPTVIIVSFVCFYVVVFVLSAIGNVAVTYTCYRAIKRTQRSIHWFIANLALADFTFTVLSTLDFVVFLWTWLGGRISCKLQSFLIEACYTSSIITLVFISFERRKAVITPLRVRISSNKEYIKIVAIWMSSLSIASPLLYAYEVKQDASGSLICNNASFGDLGKQVYYSIHAICTFIVPLTYMIYAQSTIFLRLRSRVFPTQDDFTTVSSNRHRKVAKTLAALTVAFTVCWAPFMIIRTLMYFHLTDGGYYWRASQLLIFLNTALDPILYGIYGESIGRFLEQFNCGHFRKATLTTSNANSALNRRSPPNTSHLINVKEGRRSGLC